MRLHDLLFISIAIASVVAEPISNACTCSVDGQSGDLDTKHKGYSFTGCGAHVDYHDFPEGGGHSETWCYITFPELCEVESVSMKTKAKTRKDFGEGDGLPSPEWKECGDGFRCESWWGELEGVPLGEETVLEAPLDWPDCCSLCSQNSECAGWSFHPSTGSCRLVWNVISRQIHEDTSEIVHETSLQVNGFPGYYEAPLEGCWSRDDYGLCNNMLDDLTFGAVCCFIAWVLVGAWWLVCLADDKIEGTDTGVRTVTLGKHVWIYFLLSCLLPVLTGVALLFTVSGVVIRNEAARVMSEYTYPSLSPGGVAAVFSSVAAASLVLVSACLTPFAMRFKELGAASE